MIKVGRTMGLQALLGYRVAVAVASFRTILVNTGRGKRTMPALCPRRPWVYIKQDKIQRGLLRRAARGALFFIGKNIRVLMRSSTKPLFSHTKNVLLLRIQFIYVLRYRCCSVGTSFATAITN